mmetsp:Transcript_53553/g.153724  ORF Transcript_53553/g.153724 Transcript_53553/m.153724 type:complete len:80 (-) Transcript_53553:43-282(-)|eukprot:CAMPEP_0177348720 /NCGR_PEP_ID=MMETSP0368-20130122/30415_1 /TAXON_ID=447022 ORGANISM="Scrippsiella hangoei-like, Strain SHHI-4" /NCGR_SAMPLE_ID=MMETSP0368 /ASSEMBLY_ACC=CAM_ASM_000363 /LENGTH=79 /DNA_ID=CAMNT_0018810549 /DNA_START=933 /DNA_END=1172 /DNA_ORIENTATION=-
MAIQRMGNQPTDVEGLLFHSEYSKSAKLFIDRQTDDCGPLLRWHCQLAEHGRVGNLRLPNSAGANIDDSAWHLGSGGLA